MLAKNNLVRWTVPVLIVGSPSVYAWLLLIVLTGPLAARAQVVQSGNELLLSTIGLTKTIRTSSKRPAAIQVVSLIVNNRERLITTNQRPWFSFRSCLS